MRSHAKGLILLLALVAAPVAGRMSAPQHQKELASTTEREMTLGVVQNEKL